jgi:hypothetical protein
MKDDLRGDGPCFRVHDRHDRDRDYFAEHVMKDMLNFLCRGCALFAGRPAIFSQYPTLSRSGAIVTAQRRVRGS